MDSRPHKQTYLSLSLPYFSEGVDFSPLGYTVTASGDALSPTIDTHTVTAMEGIANTRSAITILTVMPNREVKA